MGSTKKPQGFVYVARCGDFYKIGYSEDPIERMKALQTANPELIILVATIPGSMQSESYWHRTFAHKSVRGEWFKLDDHDLGMLLGTTGCVTHRAEESLNAENMTQAERLKSMRMSKTKAAQVRKQRRRQEKLQRNAKQVQKFSEMLIPVVEIPDTPAPSWKRHLSRAEIRSVPCSKCGAPAGQWCQNREGLPRLANHMPRLQLAQEKLLGSKISRRIS